MASRWPWGFEEALYPTIHNLPHPGLFRSGRQRLDGVWKVCSPDLVGWDPDRVTVVETTLTGAPRALIFRDSFTIGIHSLLKLSFSAVMFAHHHGNILDTELVREFKPDIVIYEMIDDVLLARPQSSKKIG